MIILSIETSCDETAISIIKAEGGKKNPKFSILANNVASQIDLHKKYGGVFPMMAKREHAKNIIPLLIKTLKEAKLYKKIKDKKPNQKTQKAISGLLSREHEMMAVFEKEIFTIEKPKINKVMVTIGPGLEPALWVGVNFAQALSCLWGVETIPVNHMEGHIVSSIYEKTQINKIIFPALALLISGGHTELVLVKDWGKYILIGETLDDAVGEAFDKVARMMGLEYPGGPQISKLAELSKKAPPFSFPRPMVNQDNFDFSFSGLKTAVLYHIQKKGKLNKQDKIDIAKEFQDAVTEVLVKKTFKAVKKYKIKTLLLGGGVSANNYIKEQIKKEKEENFPQIDLLFPQKDLTTDNALMIGIAGYFQTFQKKAIKKTKIGMKADGNLSFKD